MKNKSIVKNAVFKLLHDIQVISAGNMHMDVRVILLYGLNGFCNEFKTSGFSCADIDISGNFGFGRTDVCFCFIYNIENFSGSSPEQHSFLCQCDFASAADQQLFTQFIFKIHQLT